MKYICIIRDYQVGKIKIVVEASSADEAQEKANIIAGEHGCSNVTEIEVDSE